MKTKDVELLTRFFHVVICGNFDPTKPDQMAMAINAKTTVDNMVRELQTTMIIGSNVKFAPNITVVGTQTGRVSANGMTPERHVLRAGAHASIPESRSLFFDVIELMNTHLRTTGAPEITPADHHVDEAEKHINRMIAGGFKIGQYTANNIFKGQVRMYHDYPGWIPLSELLQHIWDGHTGAK